MTKRTEWPRYGLGPELITHPDEVRASRWCIVHPSAHIGRRTTIWHFANICSGVVLLEDCMVGSNVFIGANARLGSGVRIQDGAFLVPGIFIGDRVFIGPGVVTTNDRYPRVANPNWVPEPPVIEDDVNLGAGCILLPGVKISAGATIAAGAVVTKDVPAGFTVMGNPARLLYPADCL